MYFRYCFMFMNARYDAGKKKVYPLKGVASAASAEEGWYHVNTTVTKNGKTERVKEHCTFRYIPEKNALEIDLIGNFTYHGPLNKDFTESVDQSLLLPLED